ncbi:hypothetical protein E4T44_05386 [Aureobasidium sp. EXF-8845]|nr:hypothetical protein E4T44_05386 [Aureobasidium sp. EXF-8845]KAI4850825.1 hypothetical protein E4T45_05328 [Aureobasidium sp. EXF-8846]
MALPEEPRKFTPTPRADPMMRPRSPRPTHPNTTQRTRLRARNQINPISERRILNYFSFPNLADELHSLIEEGISLSDSDSDEDSDYDLPPERIHREGKQLPLTQIKWYKEGEQLAARELAVLPLMPAVTDQEDWYGIMVLKKQESESELEDVMELDSPSRQLQGELSQLSQSESRCAEVIEDVDRQPVITPTHDEVMLWVTADPVTMPKAISTDGELEFKQSLKRKRDAQEKLLQRLNNEPGPGSIYF